ncbi:putative hydrolase [Lophiotrema nucula]|uniref:Putative hydrolase n=1 Tax=Lophiotrema nucula TaxID=690887 RepID=A0A6A5ZW01_9PLEO|nr:putative hydrolase [Lophiotrema nucula]
MANWTRGFFGTLFERAIGWQLGLPSETCNYRVNEARIPIGEGTQRIELVADLYRPILPDGTKTSGTVLVRCPYGRGGLMALPQVHLLAARGYQVLFVSTRGTFGSGGDFDPFRNEVEDGKGVVEWMRQQDWYTGTFATVGASYLGFTQWALLKDPPKDMVAAVISVGPHDFRRPHWETGALNLDIIGWANSIAHQEDEGWQWWSERIFGPKKVRAVFEAVPFAERAKAFFGDRAPWVHNIIGSSDLRNSYYQPMNCSEALERADIPIFLISGWYDLFLNQSMEQWEGLSKRGTNVSLTMGPWTHLGTFLNRQALRQSFEYLQEHLSGKKSVREAPLQYFVTGAEEWKKVSQFPSTTPYNFHLQPGHKLSSEPSPPDASFTQFVFDPLKPTPTLGGNLLMHGGKVDDSALAARSDVLIFETDPLSAPIEFCGQPTVELAHSTDNPYADIFLRISEVDVNGKSHNITENYQRLDPERTEETVALKLNHCAHRFVKGTKIRFVIAGASAGHYLRNTGAPNEANMGSELKSVNHTVHFGGERVSKVTFPVVQ